MKTLELLLGSYVGRDIRGLILEKLDQTDIYVICVSLFPNQKDTRKTHKVSLHAAGKGYLKLLKWTTKNGFLSENLVFTHAAIKGQIEIMKWISLREQRSSQWKFKNIPSESPFTYAAEYGQLESMKWIYQQEPFSQKILWRASYKAIENGHLHILKWLHEKGLPLEPLLKNIENNHL